MKRGLTERADALPALTEAFRVHGLEGASVAIVSKATGLGKGSLYNFFPGGKEEMMDAVLSDIDRWFATAIFAPLEQPHDPAAAIAAMIEQTTSYFRSGGRVCIVGLVGLGNARDTFSARISGYFARWISAIADCLEAGHVPRSQAVPLAEATVAGIQGAIVLARSLRDEATFVRIVRRHQADLLDAIARHLR